MGMLLWLRSDGPSAKPGFLPTGTGYDARLIERLKDDNQILVETFSEISAAAAAKRYCDIPWLLARFKLVLQAKVMAENVKFYVYLHSKLAEQPETAEYVAGLRREMNELARAVLAFVNTHGACELTDETAGAFAQQLGQMRELLLRRVQLEESRLYTLYAA